MSLNSKTLAKLGVGSLAAGLAGGSVAVVAPVGAEGNQATTERAVDSAGSSMLAGEICVFEHDNYSRNAQGQVIGGEYCFTPHSLDNSYTDGTPDWKGTNTTINDKISSYINNSDVWVRFWRNTGGSSDSFCVAPGASTTDLFLFNNPLRDWANPEDTFSGHNTYGTVNPGGCEITDGN
jgi:hypothetical protein